MPFTGKATFSAGSSLPEIVDDVSDLVGIISPYETPLLDHLGDSNRWAMSTVHEWLEDGLLPNFDQINDSTYTNALTDTTFVVDTASKFRVGDLIQLDGSREVMLVTAVDTGTNTLTVVRAYGGSTAGALADDKVVRILGNAVLEGDVRPATRYTNRVRKSNYTQIFTASVEVSGSEQAVRKHAIADETDYQKGQRLRELVRDLENCVINGTAPSTSPEGSSSVRRSLRGLIPGMTTNKFSPGVGGFPVGDGASQNLLNEEILNSALRAIWNSSSGSVDTIVCNGFQKRRIGSLMYPNRQYGPEDEKLKNLVSVYESDFGVCRVVTSRWVPADTVLFVDSSRLAVLPLTGRSFHYKPLTSDGDSEVGELIGEYTLEMRNESAHGLVRNLGTA